MIGVFPPLMAAATRVYPAPAVDADHDDYSWDDDYDPLDQTDIITLEHEHEYFRTVYGRELNTMQPFYLLPVDKEELRVTLFSCPFASG